MSNKAIMDKINTKFFMENDIYLRVGRYLEIHSQIFLAYYVMISAVVGLICPVISIGWQKCKIICSEAIIWLTLGPDKILNRNKRVRPIPLSLPVPTVPPPQ